MTEIAFREPETAHPLQAIAPWLYFVSPSVILNKDGSLLAGFSYTGLDPDNLFDEQIDNATEQMQAAISQLDSRLTGWWVVDKRRDHSYPDNEFTNGTAAELDRLYSKHFRAGNTYSIRYTFYLLFTGATGTDKFLDRVGRIQRESEVGLLGALATAFKETVSGRHAFAKDIGMIRENLNAFERIITGLTNSVPLKFKRLIDDEFTGELCTLLNRASDPAPVKRPDDAMLDNWIPDNYVKNGVDVLRFKGVDKTVYAGCLAIKKWPATTTPKLFETIAMMDMELTICQIVRYMDAQESTKAIQQAIEYYNLTKFGMISHAIQQAGGKEATANAGALDRLEKLDDALAKVGAGVTFNYMDTCIFVYAPSPQKVKNGITALSQRLSNMRFRTVREEMNTMASFAALMPGQWALQTRWDTMSIENVSDVAPLYTMDEGTRTHEFFSEEVFKKVVPKFSVFGNTYGGRFNFSPHVGQVGHMVIIAPTGGGKTTMVNFCLSQFQRYGDVNTFIFDRNSSCKIVTELHGGTLIDIKTKEGQFNPFAALKDGTSDGALWLREWIIGRLVEGHYTPVAEDRAAIDKALKQMQESDSPLSMSRFVAMLPNNLELQLGEWLKGGPYGMFDSEVDNYSVDRWTTTEMKNILSVDRLSRAFMDYAFRKIYISLDGRPTFIYLEEASFLLNNPLFKNMIDEWLKTLRKKNAFVWMTIQSPTSISSSDISASILDNIFSFLLLNNAKVESHRDAYKKNFALEDHQVDMISKLRPKRDYLLIQNTIAHVLTTNFTPEVLAYLRSEEHVLKTFEKFREESADPKSKDWHKPYLDYITAH